MDGENKIHYSAPWASSRLASASSAPHTSCLTAGCRSTSAHCPSFAIGIYKHGVAKDGVNTKAVYTQLSATPSRKIEGEERGVCPVQLVLSVKEKNQKKQLHG